MCFCIYTKYTYYDDRSFGAKRPPSVSVTNITQLLCSFTTTEFGANGKGPVRHAMFWTATPENVHLCVIRVTRSVGDTWLQREMSTVCVYVCVCVCVCVSVCVWQASTENFGPGNTEK